MKKDDDTIPENPGLIRLLAFLISIVPTSIAVSFASFMANTYFLAAVLFPCIITLSFSIVPSPVPPKLILVCGICSFFISVGVIIYTLIAHSDLLKNYLTLPSE